MRQQVNLYRKRSGSHASNTMGDDADSKAGSDDEAPVVGCVFLERLVTCSSLLS